MAGSNSSLCVVQSQEKNTPWPFLEFDCCCYQHLFSSLGPPSDCRWYICFTHHTSLHEWHAKTNSIVWGRESIGRSKSLWISRIRVFTKKIKCVERTHTPYLSTRAITWPNLTRQFPMSSSSVAVSLVMNEFYVHHGEGFSERSFGSQLMHSL